MSTNRMVIRIFTLAIVLIVFLLTFYICISRYQFHNPSYTMTITDQGLKNLTVFSKLYGYVRYFHPSDEAAATDWNEFVVDNIKLIESATDSLRLKGILDSLFLPIAPTIQLYFTRSHPTLSNDLAQPFRSSRIVAWVHHGIDLGDYQLKQVFTSWRLNTENDHDSSYASAIQQNVRAQDYQGKRIHLRAAIKVGLSRDPVKGKLWLKIGNKISAVFATSEQWHFYDIIDTISPGTYYFEIGCSAIGKNSKVFYDDVSAEVIENEKNISIVLENPGFEKQHENDQIPGWDNVSDRHPAYLTNKDCSSGHQCVLLSNATRQDIPQRDPNESFIDTLGEGICCMIPLAVYRDSSGTLPHGLNKSDSKKDIPTAVDDERSVHIADIIIAWNIYKHFYPYNKEVGVDWDRILPIYLGLAATDKTGNDFFLTLQRFTSEARDGHTIVGYKEYHGSYWNRVPFEWDWIENQLVITQTDSMDDCRLRRGDVVTSVRGIPTEEALHKKEQLMPGATEQWKRHLALRFLPVDEQSRSIQLTVRNDGEKNERIICTFPIAGKRSNVRWKFVEDARPAKICQLQPGIMYVDMTRVSDDEFNGMLPLLEKSKGVIFDMRGYPMYIDVLSHLIDSTVKGAPMLIPIFTRPNQQQIIFDHSYLEIKPRSPRLHGKIAFLTNYSAISAAETWLAIVRHYRLGEIIGSATAGTNGTMNSCALPGGYYFTFTGIKVTNYDGSQFHGVGILPTIPVERTIKGAKEGRDELLEKAIQIVK